MSINALYEGREMALKAFKNGMFPLPSTECRGTKMFTFKQILHRFPI